MITSNKIPLLKRYRLKCIPNYDLKDKKHGSLVILNSMDNTLLKEKFGNLMLEYNNLFQFTYIKRREQLTIGSKKIIENRFDQRPELYNAITAQLPYITGINEGRLTSGYNLLFTLDFANMAFQNNFDRITDLKKPEMYWSFIMEYIRSLPLEKYNIKTMVIPLDEFSYDIITIGNKVNPITYLYHLMKRNIDKFYKLGDIDIIITSKNNNILRINPQECKRQNLNKNGSLYMLFRKEVYRILGRPDEGDDLLSDVLYKDENKKKIMDNILNKYTYGATGEVPAEVKEKIEKEVEKAVEDLSKNKKSASEEEVSKEIDKNEELIKEIVKATSNKPMAMSNASSKRDELLREKQLEIEIAGKSITEILNTKSENIVIPVNDVSKSVNTLNKNMTDIRFPNINKTYVDELMQKDLVSMFTEMNNKSIKVYVRSISVEDSSDINNYKETYTIELEDELRVRHKVVFDMPKVIDGKFLYLGGNKKFINNQQFLYPIVKIEPTVVQLVSNYNKIYIRRYGDKVSPVNEKLKKALSGEIKGVRVARGKYIDKNKKYVTTIDYDDFSSLFKEIQAGGVKICFNQEEIRQLMIDAGIKGLEEKLDKELLPIGIKGDVYYCIDLTKDEVVMMKKDGKAQSTEMNLTDFIISLSPAIGGAVGEQTSGKRYMYNRATIMAKDVPVVLLISYFEGIDGMMKRANIQHYFSDTRPRLAHGENCIQFKDGYLIYTEKPTSTALLMNGFVDIPTKNYNYQDFNDKFMYQEIFETMFGRRNLASAFDNFKDNFVDPMTLDVLQRLSMPTDLSGMMIYANELLADNQYTNEINVSRVRCAEVINALAYKNIAKAYEKYKETSSYSNPTKISLKRNAVIKDIVMEQIIEDYSELNPISEQQKLRGCLRKGPSGCNLAEAYNLTQRSYHPSMTGLFTVASSPDANVGVSRTLTMEPPIMDPRGFIDNKVNQDKIDEYNDVNLFGVAESLTYGCANGDDGPRIAMTCRQSTHCVATKKASPLLVSNGAERVLQYHVSKDWVFTAKEDGTVMELDEANGLMIVQYKSGEYDAVELHRIAKNGAGGFNVSKRMNVNFKQGQKFKKNDILAYDDKFFSENSAFGNRFNIGSFQKVALLSSAMTYEDSSYISKKLSEEMATDVIMNKQVVLGPNTNVDYIVKIGDRIESGDELIRFEKSFNEDSLNSLLVNVGDEMKEDIVKMGKDKVKSKYTGTIEDIKIYSTVELAELSPSLRKLVEGYYKKIRAKKALLEKYDKEGSVVKCNMIFNEPTGKVEPNGNGVFRSAKVGDGVLIEFYIKVHDEVGVGDKIVFYSALKSIVGHVVPEGQEAYTLFRPEEGIDAVLSCNSLISRGVTSAPKMMMSNKLLVELSRKLKDMYEGKK